MNKSHFKGIFVLIAAILITLSFNNQKTLAAQDPGSGFTITPPVFDLKANPGDKLEEVVSIYNNGSFDLDIVSGIENLKPMGEVGQVQVVEEGLPSLKDWVTVKPFKSKIAQGETRNVTFNISVPSNAEPGGHFATILFGTDTNNPTNNPGSKISQKIGSLLLLTVAGQAKENANILSFGSNKTKYFEYQPINFDLKIKNNGNTYIHPTGSITVTNIFGREIAKIDVAGKNILPGAIRQMSAQLKKKSLFGTYTANLNLIYGTSNKTLTDSFGFIVIPWKQTSIAFGIIVLIVVLRKRFWRAILVIAGKKKV